MFRLFLWEKLRLQAVSLSQADEKAIEINVSKRLVSTGLFLEAKTELMKENVNKTKFRYLKL